MDRPPYDDRPPYGDRGRQQERYSNHRGPPHQQGLPRSRSRDRYGRGGPGPEGRGGGRGGRGGPGGRDSYDHPRLEKEGMTVKTNVYKIRTIERNYDAEWYGYKVDITDLKRQLQKNESGVPILDVNGNKQFVFIEMENRKKIFGAAALSEGAAGLSEERDERSSVMTRRILLKCQEDLKKKNKFFFTDGSATAYSSTQLAEAGATSFECTVQVKADCEEDYPEASRSRNRYYKVTFTQVLTIPFRVVDGLIKAEQTEELKYILQAGNIALKNAMLKSMVGFGRGPRTFYFPMKEQTGSLLGNKIISKWGQQDTQPILGLSEALHLNRGGQQLNMLANVGLKWVRKDGFPRFPLLRVVQDSRGSPRGTLAGIPIQNLHEHIPEGDRRRVRDALAALRFHAISPSYGNGWRERFKDYLLKKNAPSEEIERKLKEKGKTIRLNQRLWSKVPVEDSVVFEPHRYTFPMGKNGDATHVTVYQYNRDKLDVELRFPKMPLVRISEREYFPVEFLYQALDAVRGANSDEQKHTILAFHDDFSGSERIHHLTNTIDQDGNLKKLRSDFLKRLNLQVEAKPTEVHAKVLEEPRAIFSNGEAVIKDGSWNLRGKEFDKAASLASWAVVDLTGGNYHRMLPGLLLSLERYGISLGPGVMEALSRNSCPVEEISQAENQNVRSLNVLFKRAIEKARAYFLQDSSGFFRRTRAFHRTRVRFKGTVEECLVVPPYDGRESAFLVREWIEVPVGSFDPNTLHHNTTHMISKRGQTAQFQARIGLRLGDNGSFIDLYDISHDRGSIMYGRTLLNPTSLQWAFRLIDRDVFPREDELENIEPMSRVSEVPGHEIDCPSMVFVYIPKPDTQLYSMIKFCTAFENGIQSRVVTKTSFDGQGNRKDSFFGGIALKINTALSSRFNSASAWSLQTVHGFLREAPTLVIGISMAATQGQAGRMVVVGTSLLNGLGSDLRMCHEATIESKNSVISRDSMAFIVKSLANQFCYVNKVTPERVLVYRSGGQDGHFAEIKATEVSAVREAFQELNGPTKVTKVTYVVVQGNSGVAITPTDDQHRNVPSGTCVDDPSVLFGEAVPILELGECNDFLLVPHGGLKGTSKPVYHRIICDEISIEKMELAKLTYWLSFLYGTATKAPRAGSVVQYSMRLANTILANLDNLFPRDSANPSGNLFFVPDASAERLAYYTRRDGDPRVFPAFSLKKEDEAAFCEPFHTHLAS